MTLGIRARFLAWLVLVILPSFVVGWVAIDRIEGRLLDRVEADLRNVRRLEATHINNVLDEYQDHAQALAAGPHVVDFVAGVTQARAEPDQRSAIGGYDGFDTIDPTTERPLTQLVTALQSKATTTGSEVVDVRLVGLDGAIYGQTDTFSWEPYDAGLVATVLASGETRFGNAFLGPDGSARLGLVAPVRSDGEVVGALVLEANLDPVVELLSGYESFGETREAHLAQPTAEGDAEFITLLRFRRDAAFDLVVPSERDLPINRSLTAPEGAVLRAADYRGIDSILAVETIEATGWGLVVKVDTAEALGPVRDMQAITATADLVTVALIIGFAAVLLNPLVSRLRRLSTAAQRMAAGEYGQRIDDPSHDEVGEVARSIDRLAEDLSADIRMRAIAESRLRHQVSHDDLTGIYNRNHATACIADLVEQSDGDWSVLFLDLDGFKSINDTYGHGVGDEVLQGVAGRIDNAFGRRATAARWGGDEFVLILADADRGAALTMAQEVRQLFLAPVATSVGEIEVRCSVGAATAEDDRSTLDEVLLEADSAMFAQKPTERERRRAWSTGERTVARALEQDRIEVWYQPILAVEPGREPTVFGAEALVRLRSDDGSLLAPDQFLDAVAQREIGVELDTFVARRATATVAAWQARGLLGPAFRLTANVGPGSARDDNLFGLIDAALAEAELAPDQLVIEVSETAENLNMGALAELAARGVAIAIDDIGTSRSNFDRLLQVRPSYAKLDRRWLSLAGADETMVLEHLVGTCRKLDMTIIAEGIEGPAQEHLAHELGVLLVQGFHYGRPVPATRFASQWLDPARGSLPGPVG